MQGCVDDDRINFPEEEDEVELISSLSIVTLLHYYASEDSLPFEFDYPISLGYSNGISISISDRDGLYQTAVSQSNGFYIDQVAFPLSVVIDQDRRSIEAEEDFKSLLIESGIPTLRDKIVENLFSCIEIVFPLTLVVDSVETEFANIFQINLFIGTQPDEYQPEVVFPISLVVIPGGGSTVEVSSLFELFKLFDVCTQCPVVSFEYEQISLFNYVFEAQLDDPDSVFDFEWYVDDHLVGSNPRLDKFLYPGEYEICLMSSTIDCQREPFCEQLVVEDLCPTPSFEREGVHDLLYQWEANFEGRESISYRWLLYRDDQPVREEHEKVGSQDHQFLYTADTAGLYTVCLKSNWEGCQPTSFCRNFLVGCPELFYRVEKEQDSNKYHFTADFRGVNLISYTWIAERDGEFFFEYPVFPGESNTLSKEFGPGTYEICLTAQPDSCEERVYYCGERIVVQ